MHKLVSVSAIAVLAVLALAACSGGKGSSSSSSPAANAPAGAPSMAAASSSAMSGAGAMKSAMGGGASAVGSKLFVTNCASCHQANGKGQAGVFPPLAGNALVTGPAGGVIHIVKDGLNGKIVVGGAMYNGQMPAWKGTLKDSDIAAVITYIRSSWGNKAPAVTTAQVTATK